MCVCISSFLSLLFAVSRQTVLQSILAATFMPPRGSLPTLVVLSPAPSSSASSLSSASFYDHASREQNFEYRALFEYIFRFFCFLGSSVALTYIPGGGLC